MAIKCQEKTAFQRRVTLEVEVGPVLALALAADQLSVGSGTIIQVMLNLDGNKMPGENSIPEKGHTGPSSPAA